MYMFRSVVTQNVAQSPVRMAPTTDVGVCGVEIQWYFYLIIIISLDAKQYEINVYLGSSRCLRFLNKLT